MDFLTIPDAIDVFVGGFCFTRCLTHPYRAEKVGALWVMRDAPRRDDKYRTEEWVGYELTADEIDRIVREHARGRYEISVICDQKDQEDAFRCRFKALGYRLGGVETFMAHRLVQIPGFDSPALIERVQTVEQAVLLAKASRARPVPPEHLLTTAPVRQYMAQIEDEVVGWVRSISAGSGAYCADMFVSPQYRQRGIARAMLSRMLSDDSAAGAQNSILLAGQAGAKLYPVVGYEQIGTLLYFFPKKYK